MYDFNLDEVAKAKVSKDHLFPQAARFQNSAFGVYGTENSTIGTCSKTPLGSSISAERVHEASLHVVKRSLHNQRPFSKYVDKNITMFQGMSGAVHIDNIDSADLLRQRAVTSMSAYK